MLQRVYRHAPREAHTYACRARFPDLRKIRPETGLRVEQAEESHDATQPQFVETQGADSKPQQVSGTPVREGLCCSAHAMQQAPQDRWQVVPLIVPWRTSACDRQWLAHRRGGGGTGPRAAGSNSGQEQEELQTKRGSHETFREEDRKTSELVEYGFDEYRSIPTTRVHTTRRDSDMTTNTDDTQWDEDCEQRRKGGGYYEKLDLSNDNRGRVRPRSSGGQALAATAAGSSRVA